MRRLRLGTTHVVIDGHDYKVFVVGDATADNPSTYLMTSVEAPSNEHT